MKNAASEPDHLRDALASLPEPLDLQYLALPANRWRKQDDFLKGALEEILPVNVPPSHLNRFRPIRNKETSNDR
jgi:hypothetical protein